MRLMNTETLELEEFSDAEVPEYAILSHRWGSEEVEFSHMISNAAHNRRGYSKIVRFCEISQSKGFKYGWVDTCCINKGNSSELIQSINSMYKWYAKSTICLAYLPDVSPTMTEIGDSEWWQRGWTLQELIAPKALEFYNADWDYIGSKHELHQQIHQITGISPDVLNGASPSECSIAQRMSWAANRITTHTEDRAYSLLGLFDVSLPMIYGEGSKAFLRLQEEIIRKSDDHSIFAWRHGFPPTPRARCGLFATSPSAFKACQDVVRAPAVLSPKNEFSMTNQGLAIELALIPYSMQTYLAILNCGQRNSPWKRLGILLEKLSSGSHYARVCIGHAAVVSIYLPQLQTWDYQCHRVYVRQELQESSTKEILENRQQTFVLRNVDVHGFGVDDVNFATVASRDDRRLASRDPHLMQIPDGLYGTAGVFYLRPEEWYYPDNPLRWLKLGFNWNFEPVCVLGDSSSMWGAHSYNLAKDRKSFHRAVAGEVSERARLFQNEWIMRDDLATLDKKGWEFLKGSKEGIDTSVDTLSVHVSIRPEQLAIASDLTDPAFPSCSVWVVDIRGRRPPREKHRYGPSVKGSVCRFATCICCLALCYWAEKQ
ncbi:MAG: hypothetical protein Q9227_007752 [Pyrenula ochraceoflavens]